MQHSMRANLPDVRDPALVEEWERRTRCRGSRSACASGELDDDAVAAIRADVEAEVEAAVTTALADEDASVDDLVPSVFAPHRRYRPARAGRAAHSPSCLRSARRSSSSSTPTRT